MRYFDPFQEIRIYENRTHFFFEGHDAIRDQYSLLKIKRNQTNEELVITSGERNYSAKEYHEIHRILSGRGGYRKVIKGHCLLGFVCFTEGHYAVIVTKHKSVCQLFGEHTVYTVEETEIVPLFGAFDGELTLTSTEERYVELFQVLNLRKEFFYSYTYDVSRSVQTNCTIETAHNLNIPVPSTKEYLGDEEQESIFVWNHFLLIPLLKNAKRRRWCIPTIHGLVAQANCSLSGRVLQITLIGRRSRFFAGTRYRKRGLDEKGNTANDVETEQILYDFLSHSVLSFTMNRSSVPLFWKQETNAIKPKPPITYNKLDLAFTSTRLHFMKLFSRYGAPVIAVNLMKAEGTSDETILGNYFDDAINYLNESLPKEVAIKSRKLDIRALRKTAPDVMQSEIAALAAYVLSQCGFFYSTGGSHRPVCVQNGVARTNCVDCLDRTNVAQCFMGIEVLAHQLAALAVLSTPRLSMDSQIVSVLSELYDLLGDQLSLQYGGSVAHKKYTRQRPRMLKHSKELLTSIQRHYRNAFADLEKQHATNLLLGILRPSKYTLQFLRHGDDWLHSTPLIDEFEPGDWWVSPLQLYYNSLRVLMALPRVTRLPYYPLRIYASDIAEWYTLFGGPPCMISDDVSDELLYNLSLNSKDNELLKERLHSIEVELCAIQLDGLNEYMNTKLDPLRQPFIWYWSNTYTYKQWIEEAATEWNGLITELSPNHVFDVPKIEEVCLNEYEIVLKTAEKSCVDVKCNYVESPELNSTSKRLQHINKLILQKNLIKYLQRLTNQRAAHLQTYPIFPEYSFKKKLQNNNGYTSFASFDVIGELIFVHMESSLPSLQDVRVHTQYTETPNSPTPSQICRAIELIDYLKQQPAGVVDVHSKGGDKTEEGVHQTAVKSTTHHVLNERKFKRFEYFGKFFRNFTLQFNTIQSNQSSMNEEDEMVLQNNKQELIYINEEGEIIRAPKSIWLSLPLLQQEYATQHTVNEHLYQQYCDIEYIHKYGMDVSYYIPNLVSDTYLVQEGNQLITEATHFSYESIFDLTHYQSYTAS